MLGSRSSRSVCMVSGASQTPQTWLQRRRVQTLASRRLRMRWPSTLVALQTSRCLASPKRPRPSRLRHLGLLWPPEVTILARLFASRKALGVASSVGERTTSASLAWVTRKCAARARPRWAMRSHSLACRKTLTSSQSMLRSTGAVHCRVTAGCGAGVPTNVASSDWATLGPAGPIETTWQRSHRSTFLVRSLRFHWVINTRVRCPGAGRFGAGVPARTGRPDTRMLSSAVTSRPSLAKPSSR